MYVAMLITHLRKWRKIYKTNATNNANYTFKEMDEPFLKKKKCHFSLCCIFGTIKVVPQNNHRMVQNKL